MEEENVDYGEADVETTIVSSKHATIEELVRIGQEIYQKVLDFSAARKVKKEHKPLTVKHYTDKLSRLMSRHKPLSTKKEIVEYEDDDEIDLNSSDYQTLVKSLQYEYKDFNASFPIFIRWTAQTGDFDPDALREFCRKHAKTGLKTMEDFLSLQTKYVTYLYKAKHPHWNTSEIVRLADQLMTALIKEEKEFKEVTKEVEKELEEKKKTTTEWQRQELLAYARSLKKSDNPQ